jgi:hypothetical protein
MTDDQMPAQSRPATDWYMMATRAVHQLGDISRDEADLAVIYGADGDHYVGEWATGMGYVNVRFPKETTRELTDAEKAYYATKVLDVAGMVRAIRFEAPTLPADDGTAYLHLDRSRDIAAQVQITESLIVDVDSDGRPVGIESLDGPVNFGALLAIVRGSVLKGHVWPTTVDGAATERPAEGTEQNEAAEDGSASPKVCGKCGTAVCLEDADRDFDWAIVTDDPAPVVRTTKTVDPAELDRLLSAEAERQVLRGTVAAVRALCDEAELADPSVVFSQGGPQWGVWTSEVRAALDGGEAE